MRLVRSRSKAAFGVVVIAILIGASLYAQAQGQTGGQAQGQAQGQGRQGGRGGPPQNLQVLPKDWTGQQVQAYMRTFTAALGVECTHCHVGTMQERAKDDNPKKGIARKMIQMVNTINGDLLKDVGEPPAPGSTKVTCFTCHRGAIKPLTAPPSGGGH
jgi:hypothetical protein